MSLRRGQKVTIKQFEATVVNPIHDHYEGVVVGYRVSTGGSNPFWSVIPIEHVTSTEPDETLTG